MEIECINDLHFSSCCTGKKIHVTPHICIPYSPLICDVCYFVFVLFDKDPSSVHGRCMHGEDFG